MSNEEPTNAELGRKIDALAARVSEDRVERAASIGNLNGKVDSLAGALVALTQRVSVGEAVTAEKIKGIEERETRHDTFHQDEQAEAERKKERGMTATVAISSAITAAAAVLAVAVTLLIAH